MIYQPKGSMCISCKFAKRDCSFLSFNTMPVIKKINSVTVSVKCTEHVQKTKEAA